MYIYIYITCKYRYISIATYLKPQPEPIHTSFDATPLSEQAAQGRSRNDLWHHRKHLQNNRPERPFPVIFEKNLEIREATHFRRFSQHALFLNVQFLVQPAGGMKNHNWLRLPLLLLLLLLLSSLLFGNLRPQNGALNLGPSLCAFFLSPSDHFNQGIIIVRILWILATDQGRTTPFLVTQKLLLGKKSTNWCIQKWYHRFSPWSTAETFPIKQKISKNRKFARLVTTHWFALIPYSTAWTDMLHPKCPFILCFQNTKTWFMILVRKWSNIKLQVLDSWRPKQTAESGLPRRKVYCTSNQTHGWPSNNTHLVFEVYKHIGFSKNDPCRFGLAHGCSNTCP